MKLQYSAFLKKSGFLEEGREITEELLRVTEDFHPLPPLFLRINHSGHGKCFKCVCELMARWGLKKRDYQIPARQQCMLSSQHCWFAFSVSRILCVCVCIYICAQE